MPDRANHRFSATLRRLPLRLTTGAFILHSGIAKLDADDDTAKQLHAMATGTYPWLAEVDPKAFTKALAEAEIALGTTLLLPVIPAWQAGIGLAGFSGALLKMYLHTPGLHRRNSIRPTHDGMAIAKDSWMLGIAVSLIVDGMTTRRRRRRHEELHTA
jgi:hypothetical protein